MKRIKFTLIELLVVISIIAVLASLLLPALQKSKEATLKIYCANNMKNMAVGFSNYVNHYEGWMPLARSPDYSATDWRWRGYIWVYGITQYLQSESWKGVGLERAHDIFFCPSGEDENYSSLGTEVTNYMYHAHLGQPDYSISYSPRKMVKCTQPSECSVVIDGKAKTNGPLYDVTNLTLLLSYADLRHRKGVNVLSADGHVDWRLPSEETTTSIKRIFGWHSVPGMWDY